MVYVIILVGVMICAIFAMRTSRLLVSALWLAGASMFTALLMYLLGAPEVAVIELSVGAGLVTILFVFAINIAGDEPIEHRPLVPRPLAWVFILGAFGLVAYMGLPAISTAIADESSASFLVTIWNERSLDMILQVVLIFAGVLGILGLMAETKTHVKKEEQS